MNSVERVLAALRREEPDRVPMMELLINPQVASAVVPDCLDGADCMDRLGMDVVAHLALSFGVVEDREDGTYVDEWGVTYAGTANAVGHPLHGPIATMEDLRRYEPPDPAAPGRLGILHDIVRRYKGRRAVLFHQRVSFMWAAYLNGLDNLLVNFLLEPDFASALLDMVLEVNIGIARRAVRAGADVISLGDDYAYNSGPMMSPQVFEHFLQPRLKRMVEVIHDEGALVIKHSDGYLYPLLDAIASCGPDALHSIEPSAGMDLATTKGLVGDRMALIGNVDCGELLTRGTPDQVREAVRQCIRDAAPGGGYLLASSNSIHVGVKPENLLAMVEARLEFGEYPIKAA